MTDESILGYSLNQIGFVSGSALSYQGAHRCFVSKKGVHKRSRQTSSRSMYHLELVSEDGEFKGIEYVEGDEFDQARKGQLFGEYGIVTNGKGIVRFSDNLSEEKSLKDVKIKARKIAIQTILMLIFLGIPTLFYLLHIITLFF